MRAMVLGPEEKVAIAKLRDYAVEHPISMEKLIATMLGREKPVGDNPNFVINIPVGLRVVYSIEIQKPGPMRHLSISVDSVSKFPNVVFVNEIMKEFGFTHEIYDHNRFTSTSDRFTMWVDKNTQSINALELI